MFIVPDKVVVEYLGLMTIQKMITPTLVSEGVSSSGFFNVRGPYLIGPIDAIDLPKDQDTCKLRAHYLLENKPAVGFKLLRVSNSNIVLAHPQGFAFSMLPGILQYLLTQDKPLHELELFFCFSQSGTTYLCTQEGTQHLTKCQVQGVNSPLVHFDKPEPGRVYKAAKGRMIGECVFVTHLPLDGADLPLFLPVTSKKELEDVPYRCTPQTASKQCISHDLLQDILEVAPYLYGKALQMSSEGTNLYTQPSHSVPGFVGKIEACKGTDHVLQCFDMDPLVQCRLLRVSFALVTILLQGHGLLMRRVDNGGNTTITLKHHPLRGPQLIPDSLTLHYIGKDPTPDTVQAMKTLLDTALKLADLDNHYVFQTPRGYTLLKGAEYRV